jgi:hypothetical protein
MSLFRRKCDVPNHTEQLISFYPLEEKLVIYDNKFWWSDQWEPLDYGKDYNFSKSFFAQWKELRDIFPLQALSNSNAVNSDYCNVAEDSRNSYLCSGSWRIEQTFYSNRMANIKDSSDLYLAYRSELCYDDLVIYDCYHVLYSLNCKNCVDSYFLYDCHGCINCFGCTNLRSKSYCMWNEQLTREEYIKRLQEMDMTDFRVVMELKKKFSFLCLNAIHRFAVQIKTINSSGDNLEGTKNCKECFDANGSIEDSKYLHHSVEHIKDNYDSGPGVGDIELGYEIFDTGVGGYRNLFCSVVYSSNNTEYCFNCYGCSNLFGCLGLRNKKYCILNKQYSKEEYEILVLKIKEQMMFVPYVDKKRIVYKYGEFFPIEISTFCYNETQAQDYFPLNQEEAINRGYKWRKKNTNDYIPTIKAKNLPDRLNDVSVSILKEIIECIHEGKCDDKCTSAFKIIEDEFLMYKKIGVPLPRMCFMCRHKERLNKRNPMKLWHRTCMCDKKNHTHGEGNCEVEFETSYAPERPEIVYCEKCYQQEVY